MNKKKETIQQKVDRIFLAEMERQRHHHSIPHTTEIEGCSVTWYPHKRSELEHKVGSWLTKETHYVAHYRLTVYCEGITKSAYYDDWYNIPCDECVPGTWD